jgi:hypothetical protein
LTLAGDILVKVDRASMAVSLEVRPVYLHRDILSLAAKIPPRLLADRRHFLERMTEKHFSGATDLTYILHSLFFMKHWVLKWT